MFFVLERNFAHTWGGTGPKMHYSGTGPVTFFFSTILAWWGTLLACGAQAVIWGNGPEIPSLAPFMILGLGLERGSENRSLASDFFCVLGFGLEPCVLDSTSVYWDEIDDHIKNIY